MDGYGMRYNHYSELPIGAFEPICGRMKLFGGGGDPIQATFDAVSNVGESISNAVSDVGGTIGDLGNQIDQSVNSAVPDGWATVGAAALAAATYGGSLAAEGAVGAGEGLSAAGEAGAEVGAGTEAGVGAATGAGTVAGADAVMPGALAGEVAGEGTAQLGAGTSLSADAASNPLNPYYSTANPTVQANTGTVSNLVGGGAESNLATLGTNPLLPTSGAGIGGSELGATGSIIGSGQGLGVQTLPETLAPTGLNGLTVNDLNSQPLLNNGTSSSITGKDVADALRAANSANNLIKSLTSSQQQLAKNQQNLQQSQALANMLKATQGQQTALPAVYKQGNPFSYAPQESINNNMASLLRNNYGNS